MAKFKFKTESNGSINVRSTFKIAPMGFGGAGGNQKKAFINLLSPKGASLTALTLIINKSAYNIVVRAGKLVETGPFPMQPGENKISFDGSSDTPDTPHEIEVTPQLLE